MKINFNTLLNGNFHTLQFMSCSGSFQDRYTHEMPLLVNIVLFAALFAFLIHRVNSIYGGAAIELDPNRAKGSTFEPHNRNYQEIAKLIIGLSSASIAAIALLLKPDTNNVKHIPDYIGWPLTCFAMAIIYGVLFAGFMSWRYEIYCHKADSFTPTWYALILSIGFSMLMTLAGGYAILAWILMQPDR